MNNPNQDIEQVLLSYKNEVMNNLHIILEKIEPVLNEQQRQQQQQQQQQQHQASDTSSGAPTMVQRHVSSEYMQAGGSGDDDVEACLGDTAALSKMDQAALPISKDTLDATEARVAVVVAKIFRTSASRIGFPAFDAKKQLLGFYRKKAVGSNKKEKSSSSVDMDESDDNENTPSREAIEADFIPLEHAKVLSMLSDEHVRAAPGALDKEIASGSKSVFRLRQHGQNLAAVKAEVFRYAEEKEDTKAAAAIDEALKDVDATGVDDDFDLSGDLSELLDIKIDEQPIDEL